MSTRRKSSNPCVLLAEDSVDTGVSVEPVLDRCSPMDHKEDEPSEGVTASEQSFYSRNISDHKDSSQSEDSFRANDNDSLSCHYKGQLLSESHYLEQTIKSKNDGFLQQSKDLGLFLHSSNSAGEDAAKTPTESSSSILEKGLEVEKELGHPALKDEIRAVSVNGTIIIPELSCHVTPLLQRPPNLSTSPAIAVPLHTSKYNPILDRNTTLITSFNRFPYPTQAELSWLTAASRHPEGQIKVWFTTQRLKQGISWSPEEVEEARKKMFNGSLAAGHQPCAGDPLEPRQALSTSSHGRDKNSTVTVSLSSAACTPGIAAAVRQTLKRSLGSPLLASEVKRHAVAPPGDPKESLCMPPPPTEPLVITSHTGLPDARTSSPDSFVASDVKRRAAEHHIPLKDKLSMVRFKERIPVVAPSVLPKERLPLSPIVSANLRRSQIHQQMNSHTSAVSSGPKSRLSCFGNSISAHSAPAVKAPYVNRAAVTQTLPAVPLSSLLQPAEPSVAPVVPCFNTYNVKEIPYGDRKHRFCDLSTTCLNDSQSSCVEFTHSLPTQFPLLERLKDKSPGQMKLLEESFQRNSFLSYNEVEHLKITTGLSREGIESWFLERRALRDDLEQALLNSMGCKPESQQALLNGAQRCSASIPFSPVPQDSKSTNLLKSVFVQSRWPSPVEMQTRLARTELMRWLRDSRVAQHSCVLDQKQTFEQRNGCAAADTTRRPSPEERPFREDNKQPGSPEPENFLGHTGSNGEEKAEDGDARGDWKTRERLSDSE